MTVSSQTYRNNRKGFYTDFGVDSNPIGTIIATLPTRDNSFDHNYIKSNSSPYPAHTETAGNAYQNGNDPAYTHPGYLYCDGSEYNISDFPALYEVIGNDYGDTPSIGIDITNGGTGYDNESVLKRLKIQLDKSNIKTNSILVVTLIHYG